MVFFTCNACGESVKKNQVEKHWQQKCRACSVLSCMDCGKDFPGDSYKEHVKCISEEEKYSGKNYKPKQGANKGERKQTDWVQQVQAAIDKVSVDRNLRDLLEQIQDYPNIPRKKAKFENFLKNSFKMRQPGLATKAWDMINAEIQSKPSQATAETDGPVKSDNANNLPVQNQSEETENQATNVEVEDTKKLSKGERKEKRKKKQSKTEKKDKLVSVSSNNNGTAHSDNVEIDGNIDETSEEKPDRKRKKHKRKKENVQSEELSEEPVNKRQKTEEVPEGRLNDTIENGEKSSGKFKWGPVIIQLLESAADNTMSLKKLKRKVLAEYCSQEGDSKPMSQEKLYAKLLKKINTNSNVKLHKEKVKLISSSGS